MIGDDHEAIIKKYSLDTVVDRYVKYRRADAGALRGKFLRLLESILESKMLNISNAQRDNYGKLYQSIKEMTEEEYYEYLTRKCEVDEATGEAYSTENPNAHYKWERCFQNRLLKHGEEGNFSNPFWLKDGTKSYSARFNDILWERNHMFGTDLYKRAWELVVDDSEPADEREERIKLNMKGKLGYFLNFDDVDEYVKHSCSFWCYGVATEDYYDEVSYQISDKRWVREFYDKYIAKLEGNPLLTIYEVRSLND